jgi:thioredoxin-like negative regulator of GroEL
MLGGDRRVGLHFSVGEARMKRGDFAGAAAAFRRAVGAQPEDPVPKVALALALAADRRYAGAAHILRRGLRGMADWNAIAADLDDILGGEHRGGLLVEQLQGAARHRPDNGDLRLLVGFLRFASGDLAEAADELQDAVDSGASDPTVQGLLLEIRARLSAEDAGEGSSPADEASQP